MVVVAVLTTLNIIGILLNLMMTRSNVYMLDRNSKREEELKKIMGLMKSGNMDVQGISIRPQEHN